MEEIDNKQLISNILENLRNIQNKRWISATELSSIEDKIDLLKELETLINIENEINKYSDNYIEKRDIFNSCQSDEISDPKENNNYEVDVEESMNKGAEDTLNDKEGLIGRFKRDVDGPTMGLWGGYVYLEGVNEPVWISEIIVRKINIEHGALIEAIPNGKMGENNQTRYYFRLLEQGDDNVVGRVERLGTYNYEFGQHYVIDVLNNEQYIVLGKDASNYEITVEQPIIFSYQENSTQKFARIVEALEYTKNINEEHFKRVKKNKNNPLTLTTPKDEFPVVLKGEEILVVSGDSGTLGYRKTIEAMGGVFHHGDVSKLNKLVGQSQRFDGVILVWRDGSHTAIEKIVKPICKEFNIPMEYADNTTPKAIKEAVLRLIEKMSVIVNQI